MRNPDKLRVAPAAEELARLVHGYTAAVASDERYGLASQMRRAAVSVGSNIFEGCGRITNRGFVASIGTSHSEACELRFQMRLAIRRRYGDPKLGATVKRKLEGLRRMLFN